MRLFSWIRSLFRRRSRAKSGELVVRRDKVVLSCHCDRHANVDCDRLLEAFMRPLREKANQRTPPDGAA